jgi:hypothetical protein
VTSSVVEEELARYSGEMRELQEDIPSTGFGPIDDRASRETEQLAELTHRQQPLARAATSI